MLNHSRRWSKFAWIGFKAVVRGWFQNYSRLTDSQKQAFLTELYARFRPSFPNVDEITPEECRSLLNQPNVLFLDVRPRKERIVSTIPGAVGLDEFHQQPHEVELVITYCTIGARSGLRAAMLKEQGYPVRNLAGSILAWAHEGLPLVNESGPTRRVHTYSKKWNLLPESHEGIW